MLQFPATVELPLRVDFGDVIRVGQTRVTLQTVVYHFQEGEPPEMIVNAFPSLKLSDVYILLGYYLDHRAEIDTYIEKLTKLDEEARREYEAAHPNRITREELLARLAAKQLA